jgi:glucosamine--fructose-6-phosphate aminotransferase (isomerizing)
MAVDGDSENEIYLFKQVGKVAALRKLIDEQHVDMNRKFMAHAGISHTRWATHGQPTPLNCHPHRLTLCWFTDWRHRSDPKAEFVVVHNGIITNYRELKAVLQNKGYVFETETDTECIAKLAKYIFDQQKGNIDFSQLAKLVVRELEGAYALLFKSVHYPNEIVATRKGSPLLIGVKTEKKLKVDFVDVEFGALENPEQPTGNSLSM